MHNKDSVYVPNKNPSYRGWSDMLLRQRKKYDVKFKIFGVGDLVDLEDETAVRDLINIYKSNISYSYLV